MVATIAAKTCPSLDGIVERSEHGLIILSPREGRPTRRILYVNSYGGRDVWQRVKAGTLPAQHLWGCLELARMGYEVALAEPLPDFYLWRNPFPLCFHLSREIVLFPTR